MIIKNKEQIEGIRKSCKLCVKLLDHINQFVEEGVSTEYIDDKINEFIISNGATSACYGYHGFPRYSCISVNEVICHGIPCGETILQNGDILNIDVGTILDGYYGDTSRMFTVGEVSEEKQELIDATYNSLMNAINVVKPGNTTLDIGKAIESSYDSNKFGIYPQFTGHGVGLEFHEKPFIMHHSHHNIDVPLKPGNIFTIEPILFIKDWDTINESNFYRECSNDVLLDKDDGWTYWSERNCISAQWEHTVLVTENGYEIFT